MSIDRLNGTASARISIRIGDDNYNEPRINLNQPVNQSYSFGSGVGEANAFYSIEYTLPASASTQITLDDASIRDLFGNLTSFASIGLVRVQHSGDSQASTATLTGTFLDTVCASGGTFNYTMGPTDHYHISTNRDIKSVGASDTIVLTNDDAVNEAIISIDLIGVSS